MAYSKTVASFCENPDKPFEVISELKVRKMLEKYTAKLPGGWKLEFRRNEHQFGVDIVCYEYKVSDNGFEVNEIGKVEVEASPKWRNGIYPHKWRTYSYLRRKVEKWDKMDQGLYGLDVFSGQMVDNADKKIYLKTAIDMSDCHCALASDIFQYGELYVDRRGDMPPDRSNYLRFPIKENLFNKRGWEDCIKYITNCFQ